MFGVNPSIEPFLLFMYGIGLINIGQGIYLIYKYSQGYGAMFPWDDMKKSLRTSGRYVSTITSLLIPPDKTTKRQRNNLIVYIALMFSSVFIVWYIAQTIK